MTILQDFFNHKLVEAGFPDGLNIEYSLSYCQGDGMAFYGTLPCDSWITLYKQINPNKSEKEYRRFAFLSEYIANNEYYNDVEITRNSFGHHYSHWNTME
ncbi:hypothetical protein [Caviibacterium pharyngocola]|uniref:Uncharacterized protein n=1 Tax=Caviibacterium pharyngocola TaxID=28159 RepID=A0A2M8RV84_9PAST|nr:hypothetical protein [Caviibacterium pharyngocola]PJG82794.1 hypothetical protein CVP04_07475 [Caviibacterium pharyngocola]